MVFDFYLGHSGHHQRLYSPKCDFAVSSMAHRAVQGRWRGASLPSQQQPRGPGQRQNINNASQCKFDSVFLPRGSYSSCSWRENMTPVCPQTTFPALSDTTVAPPGARSTRHVRLGDAPPSHPASASAVPSPLSAASSSLPIALGFKTCAMEFK